MTANQIIIPITLIVFAAIVTTLVLRNRRLARANAQRLHRPNAPDTGHNKAGIAQSAMSGMLGNDR